MSYSPASAAYFSSLNRLAADPIYGGYTSPAFGKIQEGYNLANQQAVAQQAAAQQAAQQELALQARNQDLRFLASAGRNYELDPNQLQESYGLAIGNRIPRGTGSTGSGPNATNRSGTLVLEVAPGQYSRIPFRNSSEFRGLITSGMNSTGRPGLVVYDDAPNDPQIIPNPVQTQTDQLINPATGQPVMSDETIRARGSGNTAMTAEDHNTIRQRFIDATGGVSSSVDTQPVTVPPSGTTGNGQANIVQHYDRPATDEEIQRAIQAGLIENPQASNDEIVVFTDPDDGQSVSFNRN